MATADVKVSHLVVRWSSAKPMSNNIYYRPRIGIRNIIKFIILIYSHIAEHNDMRYIRSLIIGTVISKTKIHITRGRYFIVNDVYVIIMINAMDITIIYIH